MNAHVTTTTSTDSRGKPEVEVFLHHVTVCGVRVERPPSIAPSQWLAFWQRVDQL